MSVYNIVRKRKVLETNLKSEEITKYKLQKYATDPALLSG